MVPVKGLNMSHSTTEICGTPEEDRTAMGATNRQEIFGAIPFASAKFSKSCYFPPHSAF